MVLARKLRRPTGFRAFVTIWSGQILSAVGTRMTNFALSVWLWQRTGSAFALSLMLLSAFGATVLFSPFVGSYIDRWARRATIVISDAGSTLTTLSLAFLFITGYAAVWQLYVVNFLTGAFLAFQGPAYGAAISEMVDKDRYPRANALMSMVRSMPAILAPSAAAALLAGTGVRAILLIDSASYLIAISTVFAVALPPRTASAAEGDRPQGFWADALFGFRYIARCRPFVWFEGFTFVMGVLAASGFAMLTPMVLARSGGSNAALAAVQTTAAIGGVVGGLVLTVLKGTSRKVRRLLLAILIFSVLGRILFGVGDAVVVWAIAMFFTHMCLPFMDGYTQSVWQEKVEPAVQGRVFAARGFIENMTIPVGLLIAGPLADHVFEPAMRPGGALSATFGGLVGTGRGSGMALITVAVGVIGVVAVIAGFCIPGIRDVEKLIPDFVPVPAATAPQPAVTPPAPGPAATAAPAAGSTATAPAPGPTSTAPAPAAN